MRLPRMPKAGRAAALDSATAPDAERPLDEEPDDAAEIEMPFEASAADVIDQHRDVPLGDDERSR